MHFLDWYRTCLGLNNSDEVFDYLLHNLKPSNRTWSYFVNWDKVLRTAHRTDSDAQILSALIGSTDFDGDFRKLIQTNPRVARLLPLLAVRDGSGSKTIDVLSRLDGGNLEYKTYSFHKSEYSTSEVEDLLEFAEKAGIKSLLQSRCITNIRDYLLGVEAGLDSNGRKNRGGTAMEQIVERYVQSLCAACGFTYLREANSVAVEAQFGIKTPVDKSSRRYDFVVFTGSDLVIVETNFYGGSGSKLKSTASEYRNLQDILRGEHTFVWITDGVGWRSTHRPLRETFNHNDFVLSLAMLEQGALAAVVAAGHK